MTNILPAYVPPASAADAPDHAKWSPSAMGRLKVCNASVDFVDTEPRDEWAVAQAKFGTEVHEWLATGNPPESECPAHWTAEQRQDAITCMYEYGKHVPADAYKEVKLFSKSWPQLLFGTVDALWSEDNKCINISDLKTGLRGVNAADNAQLLCYAFIASENFPTAETFRLTIIQPRRFYYDSYVYSREQVESFGSQVKVAIEGRATFVAGPHCLFCPNRGDCSTLRESLFSLLDEAKVLELWKPTGLTTMSGF